MPWATSPTLLYVGSGRYQTLAPCEYVGETQVFRIEGDFDTDLASVPRLFWSLLPPDGTYERAAVLHDWLCVRLAHGDSPVSARDADGIFRRVMREEGVGFLTRWAMWAGCRVGALRTPARRPGIAADMPLVVLITAAEAAVLAAAVTGVHILLDTLL